MRRNIIVIACALLFIAVATAFAGTVQLPQTGQTKCYDSPGVEIACAGTGQDGEIRAGVPWPNPRFTPGTGAQADCITDNLTGLMWPKNGNLAGTDMNWYSAIDYANNLTLCGYSDWRLPNVNEFESFVNANEPDTASWLNTQGFMNVQSNYNFFGVSYWSSTTHAEAFFPYGVAWRVNMRNGFVGTMNKESTFYYVLPVRSEQSGAIQLPKTGQTINYRAGDDGNLQKGVAWPNPRFSDNGNGTVTDNLTGLMWLKDANCIKTNYPAFDNEDTAGDGAVTWQNALDFVKGINNGTYSSCGAGYNNWRLANRKELRSLIDYSNYNPALPTGHPFTNVQTEPPSPLQVPPYYWASTSGMDFTAFACVDMWGGYEDYCDKSSDDDYVWPVRGGQTGSFGQLDHFDITDSSGNSIGNQSVNTPFTIKITAKDAYGNVVTGWNGEVVLSASIGSINPTKTYLSNGSVTPSVTLDSAGNNIKIWVNGGGKSSQSSAFNVTGGVATLAYISGVVKDSAGNRIIGATVYLNDGINPISSTTNSNGNYQFENLSPGKYSIWASYNGRESRTFDINISGSVTKDLVLVLLGSDCNPTALTPILLVPSIMGSSTEDKLYPTLPANAPSWDDSVWDKSGLYIYHGLLDPFGIVGWENLVNSIISVDSIHYELGCNIFTVPYDWRMSIDDAANNYLKKWIDEAKIKAGTDTVNIIAHSMGGLVTRAYIQSDAYSNRNDIDKFAMVGTPNHGAANAYYIWEGGDPKLADDVNEPFISKEPPYIPEVVNFYSNTLDNIYDAMKGKPLIIYSDTANSTPMMIIKPTAIEVRDFVHQYVPSVRQLLPTYWFLQGSVLKGIMDLESRNNTLIDLNVNLDLKGVTTTIFAGTNKDTIAIIKVGMPNDLYKDGVPLPNMIFNQTPEKVTDGDGTVLVSSALLDSILNDSSKSGEHPKLIKLYNDDLVEFVTGIRPSTAPLSALKATGFKTQTASSATNGLTINIHGRVQPYVIDPLGRKSGINPATNLMEDEIPESIISMDVNNGGISIKNVIDGEYTLYLKGNYHEDYRLSIAYFDSSKTLEYKYRGFNHSNTTSFTFTVNSSSADKITVNHTPLSPTGLQADAVDSGGLKTHLVWDISTDPNVIGYNMYSKYDDEPYLAQIGTATTNSFDTGHSWAENSTIKTRLYAVSAVKADGTESFLSNMVENNDRDHDGLTDEEETSYGTNVTNPDSDGDGLKDGEEYVRGTNPQLTDTDGDGYSDYAEIQVGSDPLDASSLPPLMGDMNGDDIIDISDVILELRMALKLDPVQSCSDINNDGIVDISDVILTLRMALKLDALKQCI